MKKCLSLLLILACACMVAVAGNRKRNKANADTEAFRYELESIQTSGTGYVNVKVWSYSRRLSIAAEQCKKNAVHGVIFKGSTGEGTQPPLVKDPAAEADHAEFFEAFFADGGDYMRYVGNAIGGTNEVVKIGKEYKTGVVVKVNKGLLRKHLEQANIIRSLDSGF